MNFIQFMVVGLKLVHRYLVYAVKGYNRHEKGTIVFFFSFLFVSAFF